LSRSERDAAYDNNKAVANSPAPIAARKEASAKFRAVHATGLDVAYGK
jgi:arylformamidase